MCDNELDYYQCPRCTVWGCMGECVGGPREVQILSEVQTASRHESVREGPSETYWPALALPDVPKSVPSFTKGDSRGGEKGCNVMAVPSLYAYGDMGLF